MKNSEITPKIKLLKDYPFYKISLKLYSILKLTFFKAPHKSILSRIFTKYINLKNELEFFHPLEQMGKDLSKMKNLSEKITQVNLYQI